MEREESACDAVQFGTSVPTYSKLLWYIATALYGVTKPADRHSHIT
jgi:hypothetical protein